jgi:hypothetical protein
VRLAYADPPYPGKAHLYADQPTYAGEVAYHELVARLDEYDGWALSTSAESLFWILPLCPRPNRVLVWVKHTIAVSWEPVVVVSARPPDRSLRDWLQCEPDSFQWRPRPDGHVLGAKPELFCRWVFEWLGADPEDSLDDLYPGSGNVGRAWSSWQADPGLPLGRSAAAEGRARRRAEAAALALHPELAEDAA